MSTDETTPLDEKALRRPDFRGGRAVTLADGQAWYIPCPEVDLAPTFLDDGSLGDVMTQTTFGPEFDGLVAAVPSARSQREEAVAMIRLGHDLLGRNYDLRPADYGRLLRYRVSRDDEEGEGLSGIYLVAAGIAPKASTAGSGSG